MSLPLKAGSAPEDVRCLQELISLAYGSVIAETGVYDTATISAVKARLGRYTNSPDGEAGKITNGKMFANLLRDLAKNTT